jgi:predicted metal-dependent hydrolase
MHAAIELPIEVRRLQFPFDQGIDPLLSELAPSLSYMLVGLSVMIPYLEPYLIRTMKTAKQQVTDPGLRRAMELFSEQEGQHYRQHMRFNQALKLRDRAPLTALEAELDADYKRFSRKRSLRFNLAYAEGFEAITLAFGLFVLRYDLTDALEEQVRELFVWHLVEELEHRTVAFDVYDHLHGDYLYRAAVGAFAQWHLLQFVVRAGRVVAADRSATLQSDPPAPRVYPEQVPLGRLLLTKFLPSVLATFSPRYTPHTADITPAHQALAAHYSQRARATGTVP